LVSLKIASLPLLQASQMWLISSSLLQG